MTPPSRKRFQIHLSTALLLMFTAGALTLLNTTPHPASFYNETDNSGSVFYGWPIGAAVGFSGLLYSDSDNDDTTYRYVFMSKTDTQSGVAVWKKEACYDLIIALAFLAATLTICEWWIRRSEARKRA